MVEFARTWWDGYKRSLISWMAPRPGKSRGRNGWDEWSEAMHAVGAAFVACVAVCNVLFWGRHNAVLLASACSMVLGGFAGLAVWCYRYGQGSEPRRPTVLLVEDDPVTWATLSREFASMGYAVLGASSVADAVQKLATSPDWVVIDYRLWGGTTALPVLRAARSMRRGPRVAVVTSHVALWMVQICVDLGAEVVVEKPDYGRVISLLGEGVPTSIETPTGRSQYVLLR